MHKKIFTAIVAVSVLLMASPVFAYVESYDVNFTTDSGPDVYHLSANQSLPNRGYIYGTNPNTNEPVMLQLGDFFVDTGSALDISTLISDKVTYNGTEILYNKLGLIDAATTTLFADIALINATLSGFSGPPFNVDSYMFNSASTSQHIATSTPGFISPEMVTKLASLIVLSTSTPSISYTNRSLNTCFQVSSTKEALVSYSVDVDSTVTLSGGAVGQVALVDYTDSGCTTGANTVSKGKAGLTGTLVVGLTLNNPATVTLGGVLPRGTWAKLVTTNITGTPTFTMNTTQEVIGQLVQ